MTRWSEASGSMRLRLAIAMVAVAGGQPVPPPDIRRQLLTSAYVNLQAARPPWWRPLLRWRWGRATEAYERVYRGGDAPPPRVPPARVVRW
jgi:hypothetical protein